MSGPLTGTVIVELAGIGPGPMAGMMLADMGAEVIRVDRPGGSPMGSLGHGGLLRNRRSLNVDLTRPEGADLVLRLVKTADALFEGFRPGVAERLGVGPDQCHEVNPRLVYGRITGWGQDGPLAHSAGHDINYIALTGALHAIGREGSAPVPPLNLVGDFGGGGMLLAFGMACALLHAERTGEGQVVDAAMIDGTSALMAMFHGLRSEGQFSEQRGTNLLDTGAPFYDVYETADDRWIAIGAIEPQFFATLCRLLEIDFDGAGQYDQTLWPKLRDQIANAVGARTRDELDDLLGDTDACYAPVLELGEVATHPHHQVRETFIEVDGVLQPAPTPRFSVSAPDRPRDDPSGDDTPSLLASVGYSTADIDQLVADGVLEISNVRRLRDDIK